MQHYGALKTGAAYVKKTSTGSANGGFKKISSGGRSMTMTNTLAKAPFVTVTKLNPGG